MCLYLPLSFVQVREVRTLLFGAMVVILLVFLNFWAYMLLWMYGMVGIIVWMWKCGCGRMNSGETWHSRPGDPASPRRDLQKQNQTRAQTLAQAESFCLSETTSRSDERGSPKRVRVGAWGMCCMCNSGEEALFGRGVFSLRQVATHLSENPWVSQGSLMTVSPKRDPVAWARLARDFTIELFLSCLFGLVCFTLSSNCMNWVTLYEWDGNYDSWVLAWCEHDGCMRLVHKI